jgi:hypothetical protein
VPSSLNDPVGLRRRIDFESDVASQGGGLVRRFLRNLIIDRVDLVDRGANQKAHIVLTKRDTPSEKEAPMIISKRANAWTGLQTLASTFYPNLPEAAGIEKAMRTTRGLELLKAYREGEAAGEQPEFQPQPTEPDTGEIADELKAWKAITDRADKLVEADPSLSSEQAIEKVSQRHPEMVRAYRNAGKRRTQ